MPLKFQPLTPGRWKDAVALFGERGACGGCWCMFWRQTRTEYEQNKGERNKNRFRKIVEKGPAPGILAYDGRTPVGWCCLAPRSDFSTLSRSRVLQPVDDQPVWSVVCFFVARPYRRKGLSVALLKAAAEFAKKKGAKIIEGYPVESGKSQPDAFMYTGLSTAFRKAGFQEVTRRSKSRPIMRFQI